MNMKKLENETQWEYIKRITENKNVYDIDYSEWSKLICGYDCSSENGRKAYYVVKRLIDKLDDEMTNNLSNNCEDSSYIDEKLLELEMKKIDLQKERIKINTLRNELNKTVREESRKELFYANLRDEVINNPLEPIQFERLYEQKPGKEYLLTFADVHFGSTFDIGINKYSPQICQEKFNKLYSEVVEIIEEEGISQLHIASLGDLVQGILRISDLTLNSITMIEQIMGISRLVANFLNQLSAHCSIIYHHTINANHSELRLLGTKSGELTEDVELLIGNYIKDLLSLNNQVEVVIGNDVVTDIELCGYNIGLTHGQHIKNKETFIRDLSVTRHKDYDFLILGHIHHYTCATVSTGKDGNPTQVISVPSIVGSCPYSKKIMKTSPSGALLMTFTDGKGKTNTFELNL